MFDVYRGEGMLCIYIYIQREREKANTYTIHSSSAPIQHTCLSEGIHIPYINATPLLPMMNEKNNKRLWDDPILRTHIQHHPHHHQQQHKSEQDSEKRRKTK
jgi:hypothetical protein